MSVHSRGHENTRKDKKSKIAAMLQAGTPDIEIARSLGTTLPYVQKVKSEKRKEGVLIPSTSAVHQKGRTDTIIPVQPDQSTALKEEAAVDRKKALKAYELFEKNVPTLQVCQMLDLTAKETLLLLQDYLRMIDLGKAVVLYNEIGANEMDAVIRAVRACGAAGITIQSLVETALPIADLRNKEARLTASIAEKNRQFQEASKRTRDMEAEKERISSEIVDMKEIFDDAQSAVWAVEFKVERKNQELSSKEKELSVITDKIECGKALASNNYEALAKEAKRIAESAVVELLSNNFPGWQLFLDVFQAAIRTDEDTICRFALGAYLKNTRLYNSFLRDDVVRKILAGHYNIVLASAIAKTKNSLLMRLKSHYMYTL